jgi:hypothetical protein
VPNPGFPINVNVNFNGVSYNAQTGAWTGDPSWTVTPYVQPVTPIKAGTGENIVTWTLHAAAVPRGFTAMFPQESPVTFKPTPPWPGSTPVTTSNTTVQATDNFNGLPANQICEYTIAVILINGTVMKRFLYDPDVENEGGTVNVNVVAIARLRK